MSAQAQNRPQFRSGVEVTSIDVTVVDNRGRSIPDLKPGEFLVRVDGVPRRVVSADWMARTSNTSGRSTVPPSAKGSSSNEAGSGRLILIVIDQPNIRFGGTIGHRAAISTFIDRLQPSDRVGVVNLGVGGKSVSFTTDRRQAKQVVSSATGGVPYPPSSIKTAGDVTLDFLRALLKDLRAIDLPKTMLLVSQGLIFSEEARPSFEALERAAASARTTIYALGLDARISDITQKDPDPALGPAPPNGSPEASGAGRAARALPDSPFPAGPAGDQGAKGLEVAGELLAVAAATGGAMFTVVMTADAALARIESELSGYYLLAIESAIADRDGKPHSLKVDISRRGVTVRAGRYLP
jgi:VWFA-related protein